MDLSGPRYAEDKGMDTVRWKGKRRSLVGQVFKVKQALEGLLLYTGSWRFYSKITDDQPKDLHGLMSRAEDKEKGKGKEEWRGWRRWTTDICAQRKMKVVGCYRRRER